MPLGSRAAKTTRLRKHVLLDVVRFTKLGDAVHCFRKLLRRDSRHNSEEVWGLKDASGQAENGLLLHQHLRELSIVFNPWEFLDVNPAEQVPEQKFKSSRPENHNNLETKNLTHIAPDGITGLSPGAAFSFSKQSSAADFSFAMTSR